jgi:two-component system, sensor histidine kinase and response regulator
MMQAKTRPDGKVLVVEDSRTQAEYLGHILKKEGIAFAIAENGRVALEMIARERPALVLTDIIMPEMDGYELCRRIRKDKKTAGIPVIMVTQLFDPADVLLGLEAGADNFIIKPFEPDSVLTSMAQALGEADKTATEHSSKVLDVEFAGKHYSIRAGHLRILNILISTYDLAIKKNLELHEAQDRLLSLNEQLQQMVEELQVSNDDLQVENNARERAERDLAQANKKLQLMTSITRHDLLNHLTGIQGYLDLTAMLGRTDPEKTATYIDKSLSVVQKAISTVQFTGDYQRIGVNSPVWHNVPVIIDKSLNYATLGAIRLENEVPPGIEIYADPLIEKAIFNLIDNAVRYGATLTSIRFYYRAKGDHAILTCEDDGVGVPDKDKERIFSFGYGTNTGMGLFLVREILAITGITIRETGIHGKGARFDIIIPKNSFRVS